MQLPRILCIVGPTASGKTSLALRLAREWGGEIVNADSRQVYRGMDIATGKEIAADVPHHVFDVADPDEDYSLATWKMDAEEAIDAILARGKLPIVVGGTGLYVRALVENLEIPDVPPNPLLRAELEAMTTEEMAAELELRDPDTFAVIDQKNPRRLLRALEVVRTTGESFVQLGGKRKPKYAATLIGLKPQPEVLRHAIADRVDAMVEAGLVNEARELALRYGWDAPSMSGIGYPEARRYLEGMQTEAQMKSDIVLHSLQYAKRQLTFFRKLPVAWFEDGERAYEHARTLFT